MKKEVKLTNNQNIENTKGEDSSLLDFYTENGRTVFTEHYHKKRGFCCGNKCRHCCFWPRNTKGVTEIKSN